MPTIYQCGGGHKKKVGKIMKRYAYQNVKNDTFILQISCDFPLSQCSN